MSIILIALADEVHGIQRLFSDPGNLWPSNYTTLTFLLISKNYYEWGKE